MKYIQVPKAVIALSCLSMVVVTSSLLLSIALPGQVSGAESDDWQPLSTLVEQDTLLQIVTDNTAPSADRAEIAKSAIGLSKGDLLVVDFETAALCGRGGCAVAAYRLSTNEQILFTYARQPAGEPIVELVTRDADLPCLRIAPPINRQAQGLTKDTLCYRGGTWVTEAL